MGTDVGVECQMGEAGRGCGEAVFEDVGFRCSKTKSKYVRISGEIPLKSFINL